MNNHTLLIHGWSDCSDSFREMKNFLSNEQIGPLENIYLTDYQSREDNLTFNDIADGFNDQLMEKGLIGPKGEKKGELNVIVHSTGGLVVRHWIWRYYYREGKIDDCPIKRLVMLAPANFGSPLAHRGKSFLGSMIRGQRNIRNFREVGRKILTGLELASPYQWNLAHRDLLIDRPYFNKNQIQLSILTGIKDYGGLRSLINKPGTDGTVVISGTPLNSAKVILDCTELNHKTRYTPISWQISKADAEHGFGVLEDYDHGTIVSEVKHQSMLGELVLEALRISSPEAFGAFKEKLENITETTYQRSSAPKFQQFIIHAMDDHEEPINDFTLQFFVRRAGGAVRYGVLEEGNVSDTEAELSFLLNELLTENFHTHSQNSSYRRFLVDMKKLETLMENAINEIGAYIMSMRVHVPAIDGNIEYAVEHLKNIVFYDSRDDDFTGKTFFFPNTTTLMELRINRRNRYVELRNG